MEPLSTIEIQRLLSLKRHGFSSTSGSAVLRPTWSFSHDISRSKLSIHFSLLRASHPSLVSILDLITTEGNRPPGRSRNTCKDHIETDLEEIGFGRVDWIHVAQDRVWIRAVSVKGAELLEHLIALSRRL